MTEQVAYTVTALGSASALDQAKRRAREDGWRIRTVASVRPSPDGQWVVRLAVSRPSWAVAG